MQTPQATASRSLDTLKADTKREEAKLKEARESLARFLDDARALCKRQLDYLEGNAAAMPAAPLRRRLWTPLSRA